METNVLHIIKLESVYVFQNPKNQSYNYDYTYSTQENKDLIFSITISDDAFDGNNFPEENSLSIENIEFDEKIQDRNKHIRVIKRCLQEYR